MRRREGVFGEGKLSDAFGAFRVVRAVIVLVAVETG